MIETVTEKKFQFVLNGKTWNLFDESDAAAFDAMFKDALRYRWLATDLARAVTSFGAVWGHKDELDAAIDAAINAQTSASPTPASESARPE